MLGGEAWFQSEKDRVRGRLLKYSRKAFARYTGTDPGIDVWYEDIYDY